MTSATATRVPAGRITVETRDDAGRKVAKQVELTVEVAHSGEPVKVKTEDKRTVEVSRKLAELYPERYTEVAPQKTAPEAD